MDILRTTDYDDVKSISIRAATPEEKRLHPYQVQIETVTLKNGSTIPSSEYKLKMWPENSAERQAAAELKETTSQFAIYTAGEFGADGEPRRLKGPAYLDQAGPTSPPARQMGRAARTAWASREGLSQEVAGRIVESVPVFATDPSCVDCHNDAMGRLGVAGTGPNHAPFKVGDRLGLILLSYKPRQ